MKPPSADAPTGPEDAAPGRPAPPHPEGEPEPDIPSASPNVAAAEGDGPLPPPPPAEEVDVWWGSYAGRTMLPSLAVCLLATALLAWPVWVFAPRGYFRMTYMSLAAVIWLVVGGRWAYRFFGYTYRLTTRRLFRHRGFSYTPDEQVDLADVTQILVRCRWTDRLVGVGQVVVLAKSLPGKPFILEGVRHPMRIAEEIRVRVKKAHEG
jgi:hypothetical protein